MAKIPGQSHQVAVWWTDRELSQALGFGMITGAPIGLGLEVVRLIATTEVKTEKIGDSGRQVDWVILTARITGN
jgi:hypothetical protein